ncbi:MAG: NAD-dependent epimerase/dehydratase family protein [Halieaceae bacterium]|nr:NAD-dependent epimerase/dehydratase family protein [Halieaceae bacterium]
MKHQSIAIVGFGDIGRRLCACLPPRWRTVALRRRAREVPAGVRGVAVDLRDPASLTCLERLAPDALLITLSPDERSVEGYRAGFAEAMQHIVAGLGEHRPRRAFFLSSTRVYAEADGGWADEDSPLAHDEPFARAIIDAENILLDALASAVVLRAGGLYGNGPGPLLRAVAAGRLRPREPVVYGNRCHRDDVAACLAYLLEHDPGAALINLVDDGCVSLQEVEAWLCEELHRPYEPPAAGVDPPAPRHKRVRNDRLHATGYALRYPDYRSGYGEVLRQWVNHSEREDGLDFH